MEEDPIFLDSFLEVLYNDKNLEILNDYNITLRTLAEWFHNDCFFDVQIYGSGLDSRPQLLHFRESFGDNWRIMHEVTPQTALFIHRLSAVLPMNAVEYKENYPLLFYMTPTTANPGLVKLWMSSRTHSLIMKNHYGLPLKECIEVRHDERKIPKFYLSSAAMLKLFRPDRKGNFLMFHRHSLASSYKEEKSNIRVALSVFDFKELGTMQRAPDGVYALQTLPALHCPDWPEFAQEWVYRKRKWPIKAVIQEAMNKGVHFIPPQSSRTSSSLATIDFYGNSALNNSDIIWAVDFSSAQSVIIKNLNKEQRLVFLFSSLLVRADTYRCNVQLVLDKYEEQDIENLPVVNIILHCIFWFYEGLSADSVAEQDIMSNMCKVLGKYADCLTAKDCPNYFLPGLNLLSAHETGGEIIDCYILYVNGLKQDKGKICEVLKTCGILHEDVISSPTSDTNQSANLLSIDITKQLKKILAKSVTENIKLLALQLYQSLHATDSVDQSITKHKGMLSILPKKDQPLFQFLAPLKFFISSSLGSVYAAKAASSLLKKDKKYFKTKAEETLLVSTDTDTISGVVNLANYYCMVGEMENVIECLEPLLKAKNANTDTESDFPQLGIDEPFREIWLKRNFSYDVMFSNIETSIVTEHVEKCFALSVNQQLGYTDQPVSTFDAKFYAGYLLALAYAHDGKIEFCKGVLLTLELECDAEQPDMNEKRLAAYLNLMADVHLSIGNKGEALSLLQRSLMILPNPSNPARWKVLSIKTEKARKYITWGLGVFVVTTATALGYTVLKPNALK